MGRPKVPAGWLPAHRSGLATATLLEERAFANYYFEETSKEIRAMRKDIYRSRRLNRFTLHDSVAPAPYGTLPIFSQQMMPNWCFVLVVVIFFFIVLLALLSFVTNVVDTLASCEEFCGDRGGLFCSDEVLPSSSASICELPRVPYPFSRCEDALRSICNADPDGPDCRVVRGCSPLDEPCGDTSECLGKYFCGYLETTAEPLPITERRAALCRTNITDSCPPLGCPVGTYACPDVTCPLDALSTCDNTCVLGTVGAPGYSGCNSLAVAVGDITGCLPTEHFCGRSPGLITLSSNANCPFRRENTCQVVYYACAANVTARSYSSIQDFSNFELFRCLAVQFSFDAGVFAGADAISINSVFYAESVGRISPVERESTVLDAGLVIGALPVTSAIRVRTCFSDPLEGEEYTRAVAGLRPWPPVEDCEVKSLEPAECPLRENSTYRDCLITKVGCHNCRRGRFNVTVTIDNVPRSLADDDIRLAWYLSDETRVGVLYFMRLLFTGVITLVWIHYIYRCVVFSFTHGSVWELHPDQRFLAIFGIAAVWIYYGPIANSLLIWAPCSGYGQVVALLATPVMFLFVLTLTAISATYSWSVAGFFSRRGRIYWPAVFYIFIYVFLILIPFIAVLQGSDIRKIGELVPTPDVTPTGVEVTEDSLWMYVRLVIAGLLLMWVMHLVAAVRVINRTYAFISERLRQAKLLLLVLFTLPLLLVFFIEVVVIFLVFTRDEVDLDLLYFKEQVFGVPPSTDIFTNILVFLYFLVLYLFYAPITFSTTPPPPGRRAWTRILWESEWFLFFTRFYFLQSDHEAFHWRLENHGYASQRCALRTLGLRGAERLGYPSYPTPCADRIEMLEAGRDICPSCREHSAVTTTPMPAHLQESARSRRTRHDHTSHSKDWHYIPHWHPLHDAMSPLRAFDEGRTHAILAALVGYHRKPRGGIGQGPTAAFSRWWLNFLFFRKGDYERHCFKACVQHLSQEVEAVSGIRPPQLCRRRVKEHALQQKIVGDHAARPQGALAARPNAPNIEKDALAARAIKPHHDPRVGPDGWMVGGGARSLTRRVNAAHQRRMQVATHKRKAEDFLDAESSTTSDEDGEHQHTMADYYKMKSGGMPLPDPLPMPNEGVTFVPPTQYMWDADVTRDRDGHRLPALSNTIGSKGVQGAISAPAIGAAAAAAAARVQHVADAKPLSKGHELCGSSSARSPGRGATISDTFHSPSMRVTSISASRWGSRSPPAPSPSAPFISGGTVGSPVAPPLPPVPTAVAAGVGGAVGPSGKSVHFAPSGVGGGAVVSTLDGGSVPSVGPGPRNGGAGSTNPLLVNIPSPDDPTAVIGLSSVGIAAACSGRRRSTKPIICPTFDDVDARLNAVLCGPDGRTLPSTWLYAVYNPTPLRVSRASAFNLPRCLTTCRLARGAYARLDVESLWINSRRVGRYLDMCPMTLFEKGLKHRQEMLKAAAEGDRDELLNLQEAGGLSTPMQPGDVMVPEAIHALGLRGATARNPDQRWNLRQEYNKGELAVATDRWGRDARGRGGLVPLAGPPDIRDGALGAAPAVGGGGGGMLPGLGGLGGLPVGPHGGIGGTGARGEGGGVGITQAACEGGEARLRAAIVASEMVAEKARVLSLQRIFDSRRAMAQQLPQFLAEGAAMGGGGIVDAHLSTHHDPIFSSPSHTAARSVPLPRAVGSPMGQGFLSPSMAGILSGAEVDDPRVDPVAADDYKAAAIYQDGSSDDFDMPGIANHTFRLARRCMPHAMAPQHARRAASGLLFPSTVAASAVLRKRYAPLTRDGLPAEILYAERHVQQRQPRAAIGGGGSDLEGTTDDEDDWSERSYQLEVASVSSSEDTIIVDDPSVAPLGVLGINVQGKGNPLKKLPIPALKRRYAKPKNLPPEIDLSETAFALYAMLNDVFSTKTTLENQVAVYTSTRGPRRVVVAFRGSANRQNGKTDAYFYPPRAVSSLTRLWDAVKWHCMPHGLLPGPPVMHPGFLKAAQLIYPDLRTILLRAVRQRRAKSVEFTGHSLGGAIATLCALFFKIEAPQFEVSMTTFGSPRVGNPQFAALVDLMIPHWRVVHDGDVVPASPPWYIGFLHCGMRVIIDQTGQLFLRTNAVERVLCTQQNLRVGQHLLATYVSALAAVHAFFGLDPGGKIPPMLVLTRQAIRTHKSHRRKDRADRRLEPLGSRVRRTLKLDDSSWRRHAMESSCSTTTEEALDPLDNGAERRRAAAAKEPFWMDVVGLVRSAAEATADVEAGDVVDSIEA